MINTTDRSLSRGVPAARSSWNAGKPQTLEMNAGTSGADVTTHANHETNEQPERLASTHRRHPRRTRS
jgi:hypothetical protein